MQQSKMKGDGRGEEVEDGRWEMGKWEIRGRCEMEGDEVRRWKGLPFFSSNFRLCPIRRACPTLLHAALFGLPPPREIEPTSMSNLCSSFFEARAEVRATRGASK